MSEDTNNCGCACATSSTSETAAERAAYRRPSYTVTESAEAFDLDVLVPGVDKEGVNVALNDRELAIAATRTATAPEAWRPLRREIPACDYRLTLRLNVPVDAGRIEAKVADGVLRVRLPKAEEVKPRTIPVR